MIILGIDPGFAIVGAGVIEYQSNKLIPKFFTAIETSPKEGMDKRLKTNYDCMTKIIEKYKPDAVAIEELFFNANAKTAIAVGQGRGVLILAAANSGVPVFEYTPLQVKQAVTGYGRADKQQVQLMVKTLLGLNAIPKPDDAADALALSICHAHTFRTESVVDSR